MKQVSELSPHKGAASAWLSFSSKCEDHTGAWLWAHLRADCPARPMRSPCDESTVTHTCLESFKHIKHLLHVQTQAKTTTPFSPDATTVLAHNVFSMLRLSWTGGSLSSYSGREKKEKCKLATFLLFILQISTVLKQVHQLHSINKQRKSSEKIGKKTGIYTGF